MYAAALLTVALSLPRAVTPDGYGRETDEAYRDRLSTIATAIADVSATPELAAAVLAHMYAESTFDPLVHAGLPHPYWHGDHGKATCLGQLWKSALVPDWSTLAGTDLESTTRCAYPTARVIRSAAWMCNRGSMLTAEDAERAFALMGNGHSCAPTVQSRHRAQTWRRVVNALRRSP